MALQEDEERQEYISRHVTRDELENSNQSIREDFMLIFGVFAALLIFIGVEIQVFDKAPRFSMLVGFSSFLLGAILAFLLALQNILKQKVSFSDYYNNPLVYFILACFSGAVICFAWAHFVK